MGFEIVDLRFSVGVSNKSGALGPRAVARKVAINGSIYDKLGPDLNIISCEAPSRSQSDRGYSSVITNEAYTLQHC